jgi:hypothetical protein
LYVVDVKWTVSVEFIVTAVRVSVIVNAGEYHVAAIVVVAIPFSTYIGIFYICIKK